MAYNPSLYSPYGYQQPQVPQQPINGLVWIDSQEGAQMYPLPPNSVSPPLLLRNENAFFVKTTDGGGAASLKRYTFDEDPIVPTNNNSGDFVTREYFDQQISHILEVIENGQHTTSEPESAVESDDRHD